MKIEAGKFYKTRENKKAYVAGLSPFTETDEYHRAVGFIAGHRRTCSWTATGRFTMDDGHEDDLIAEWVDPPTPLEVCKKLVGAYLNEPDQLANVVDMAEQAIAAAEAK